MFYAFIALLFCLLLIALFAASEAALAAPNRVRLRHLLRVQSAPDEQDAAQSLSSEISRDTQQFIATTTLAANVPLMAAAALTIRIAHHYFRSPLITTLLGAIALLLMIPLFQITPRLLVAQPGALDKLWWVRPARLTMKVLQLPVSLLLALGRFMLRPLGIGNITIEATEADDEGGLESAHEIIDLVESAHESGAIAESDKEIIDSIITFSDTRVHEVMLPRPDIIALPIDSELDVVLNTFQQSGFSRLPFYEENIDRVVGILHIKDVLARMNTPDASIEPRQLLREPLFIPEATKIDEALHTMRVKRTHMALAIDEFGGTAGLFTIEDILEELVGEIRDEHDYQVNEPVLVIDTNSALVDALLHTEDLRDLWDLALPEGEFDTVGGFVIEQLGRAPVAGDRIEIPGAVLVVYSVQRRRPRKILITRTVQAAPQDIEAK